MQDGNLGVEEGLPLFWSLEKAPREAVGSGALREVNLPPGGVDRSSFNKEDGNSGY